VENVCDNNGLHGLHGLLGHSRTSIYKSYHSKDELMIISNLFLGTTILSINSVSIVHGKVVNLRTACTHGVGKCPNKEIDRNFLSVLGPVFIDWIMPMPYRVNIHHEPPTVQQ